MSKRFLKYFLIIGILGLVFSSTNFCLASPSIVPLIGITDGEGNLLGGDGISNVPVDGYFQWQHVAGATTYVLRIKGKDPISGEYVVNFDLDIDSIAPPPGVSLGDTISYPFLQVGQAGINYVDAYGWKVRANFEPDQVFDETPWWSFSTEQAPAPPSNGGNGGGIPIGLINPLEADTLEEAINAFINFLFFLAMAIAPILIIYAAFLLLTAAGDAAKIRKARQIILWTLVAVAIILLAKGLPSVIKGAMGG